MREAALLWHKLGGKVAEATALTHGRRLAEDGSNTACRQATATTAPLPDSPVGCSRWNSVNVDFGFDTEDRLVLRLTLCRHLDFYSVAGGGECFVGAALT